VTIPNLHAAQKEVLRKSKNYRFKCLCCGRRWGKTKIGIYQLMMGDKGLLDNGYASGWFAPSAKYVADVWDEICNKYGELITYKNKQSGRIKFVTGSVLDFWAMGENQDVARGRKYARVVIDEAAHIRYLENAWQRAVAPTLTDYAGEAWFISTPNGMNYFYELFNKAKDNKDWYSCQSPTSENPYIRESVIEAARQELPSLVFEQEYLAKFVVFGGNLVRPENLIAGKCPDGLPVVFGVDLAISDKQSADYTAIVVLSKDPDTGIVYIREVIRYRLGFHKTLELIRARAEYWQPVLIAIERVQYQTAMIQELSRTTNLPVWGVVPDKNKVTRFIPLLTRYEQNLVRHDPGVPAWFKDELLSFPDGAHDDGVDAAAYAFAAENRRTKMGNIATYAETVNL
jgi:predicted phage terminase large subunit-like protein